MVISARMRRPKISGFARVPGIKNNLINTGHLTEFTFVFWVIRPSGKRANVHGGHRKLSISSGNEHLP